MSEDDAEDVDPNIYKLLEPVDFCGEPVTEIKLLKPTFGKLAKAKIHLDLPASEDIKTIEFDAALAKKVILVSTTCSPIIIEGLDPSDATMLYYKCIELFFAKMGS